MAVAVKFARLYLNFSVRGANCRYLSNTTAVRTKVNDDGTTTNDQKSSDNSDSAVNRTDGESSHQGQGQGHKRHSASGLFKAVEMFEKVEQKQQDDISDKLPDVQQSFAALLRKSYFIGLGDPRGNVVMGTIFDVVEDDLYVEFGGKFHCVCKKPKTKER